MDGCSSIHHLNFIGCKQRVNGSILVMSPCVISDNRWTPSQRGRLAWLNDHTAGGYSAYEQFRIGHYYKVAALLTAKNSSISSRRDTPKFQPVLSSQPKSAPHEVTIPCENLIDDGCQLLTMWNKFQPWRTLFTRSRSDHNAHPPGICSNSYNNLTQTRIITDDGNTQD